VHHLITAACAAAVLTTSAACSLTESNKPAQSGPKGPVLVESSDDACALSTTKAASGRLVFRVKNTGAKVTEFYVYDENGSKIVAEVENIGPGLSRDLVVTVAPGTYVTACKPGMSGKGIRADFTVTDSGEKVAIEGLDQGDIDEATADYASYVQEQTRELLAGTKGFVAAYVAGDDDKARALYAPTRAYWERIEPVAESFGDLDPKMDLREADLQQGQAWTGWHRIEKDLWPPSKGYSPLSADQRRTFSDDLVANTRELDARVGDLDFTLDQIGNGSKSLLDEVASTKITGEEEAFSHTDLWDIEANVDGAKEAFEAVEDLLKIKDAELYESIETQFEALEETLDQHRRGQGGFVSYDKVTEPQRKELSDAVNALAEPLSKMTGAITL
jgi:iron uptake system component EfeO